MIETSLIVGEKFIDAHSKFICEDKSNDENYYSDDLHSCI